MTTQDVINVRRRMIVNLLVNPMTAYELSQAVEASYHTVRRDVAYLLDRGEIAETGDIRRGGALYIAGNQRPMPELKANRGEYVRMDVLAQGYMRSPLSSNGSRAVLQVASVITELLALASNYHVNNREIDANELKQLEFATQQALANIETVVTVTKSLLADKYLWDVRTLPGIVADPAFSPNNFLEAYEMLLRTLAAETE